MNFSIHDLLQNPSSTTIQCLKSGSLLTFLGLLFGGLAASIGDPRDGFDFTLADWRGM